MSCWYEAPTSANLWCDVDRASTPGTKLCYSIPRDSLDGHLFRVFIVSDNHLDNGTGPPGARGYGVLCPKKHLTEEGRPTR